MKYENLIRKIEQKEELDEDETLDIVFVPKFISKENGKNITETLAKVFKYAIITEKMLKMNIGVLLGAMILKHFDDDEKINELMEEIGMKQIDDEIKIIAREEFKEDYEKIEKEKQKLEIENINVKKEYDEVKKENKAVKKENDKLKEGIERLKEIPDLNSQEAKKIISTLSLL